MFPINAVRIFKELKRSMSALWLPKSFSSLFSFEAAELVVGPSSPPASIATVRLPAKLFKSILVNPDGTFIVSSVTNEIWFLPNRLNPPSGGCSSMAFEQLRLSVNSSNYTGRFCLWCHWANVRRQWRWSLLWATSPLQHRCHSNLREGSIMWPSTNRATSHLDTW